MSDKQVTYALLRLITVKVFTFTFIASLARYTQARYK